VVPRAGEAVGAIINGQWKLIGLVGEGGLAAVYEAHAIHGDEKRAIKILHPQFVSQRAIVERFYAEAKACFSLRHPHITSVEAYAYAEDGSPYIVMELLYGMSLEQFLRKKQPMTPAMASPIIFGILQALSAAHARGIVHRDLKPANLFLTPNNGEYTVKVLDFGIAKVIDIAGGMGSKTRTGAVLGTPGYMSPEQVKNAKAVDARTDLWAIGVVAFEMMCCEHPYGSDDQLARMVAVLRDAPAKFSTFKPELAAWDPFFDKSLARDPADRYQSAQEMAEAVRTLAQGTPARFVPDGLQTVALPMMPDLMKQYGVVAAAPKASPPTAGPGTAASPALATHTHHHAPQPPQQQYPSHSPPATPPVAPQPYALGLPGAGLPGAGLPRAGMPGASPTQISADSPEGPPAYYGDYPQVQITEARDEDPPAVVWWGVVVIAMSTFAIGMLLGYLLGAS
jgi:serine/threonine protein kinase